MARLRIYTTLLVAGSVVGWLGRWFWLADLASHFCVQYSVGLSVLAVWLWLRQQRRFAMFALLFALLNVARFIPFFFGTVPPPPDVPLQILSTNVFTSNPHKQKLTQLIENKLPDVVFAMEVDNAWTSSLKTLEPHYGFAHYESREDNFGIAFLSKETPSEFKIHPLGDSQVPCVEAQFKQGSKTLTIIGVHVLPPMSSGLAQERNRQLTEIATLVKQQTGAIIVVGDLNCTPWSPYFVDLLRDTQLHDGRYGFGLLASWHTSLPGLRLPIDHCLASSDVTIHELALGPPIGSDHFPIFATTSWRGE